MISANDRTRLASERNIWLATVRPNNAPHLVPIWFVWVNDKAYICTSRDSIKARNILKNPQVAFALENGDDPVLVQGTARLLEDIPAEIVRAFQDKFEWSIQSESTYNTVIEITPVRVVL